VRPRGGENGASAARVTTMTILEGIDGLRRLPPGAVVSIGNFDGIHLGHESILATMRSLRARAAAPALAVVTFEPHPLTVLRPEAVPPRLTPPGLKDALLAERGVDLLVRLPPAPEVLDLSAERFWEILRDDVRPAHLVEGGTFNFGKGRRGSIRLLQQWAAGTGVEVNVIEPVSIALLDFTVVPVSSSLIRWLLFNGRVRDAAICLGRPFALEGPVVKGHQRGRALGMPTANLDCGGQLVPADGVYAGRCRVNGADYAAAVSIGTMPTFGDNRRQVEAYLLGFEGDLYGSVLRVELLDWVREQRKFAGVDALKAQMAKDLEVVADRKTLRAERPVAAVAS
jgi:riboflavin kinase/FMN adenylyltransferase